MLIHRSTHHLFSSGTQAQNNNNIFLLCLQLSQRSKMVEWRRRRGPILTTCTIHYISTALPCLAATQTFTYLYDNRREQSSMWQQQREAAQYQPPPTDKVICGVIWSVENKRGKNKRREETHVFMCDTIWSWVDWQWTCQQQSRRKSLLLGKISLEKILMLQRG